MVDLKALKKLVKYLRKEGITEFKSDGLEFKLSPEVPKVYKAESSGSTKVDVSDQVNDVPNDGPSQEELLFWSSGGPPPKEENN